MSKRPRRSAAEWSEIVAQYLAGAESEEAFCQRHDLSRATFRKWRYRNTPGRAAAVAARPRSVGRGPVVRVY